MWALWLVTAIAIGVLALGTILYLFRPSGDGSAEWTAPLPQTPLQRAAWRGLVLGVLVTLALVAVLALTGPDGFAADGRVRGAVYGLLIIGAIPVLRLSRAARPGSTGYADERDRAILARAPVAQVPAMIAVLAAWTVILTERYWTTGEVPVVFLALILWSCVFVAIVALPLGILMGYREAR
jgi:hypothetical protein